MLHKHNSTHFSTFSRSCTNDGGLESKSKSINSDTALYPMILCFLAGALWDISRDSFRARRDNKERDLTFCSTLLPAICRLYRAWKYEWSLYWPFSCTLAWHSELQSIYNLWHFNWLWYNRGNKSINVKKTSHQNKFITHDALSKIRSKITFKAWGTCFSNLYIVIYT